MKSTSYAGTMLVLMGALSACTVQDRSGQDRNLVTGQTGTLFGTPASTWARLDAQGAVQEVGVSLATQGIAAAPVPPATDTPPTEAQVMAAMMAGPTLRLQFPAVVKDTTFLDHLDLYWEARGIQRSVTSRRTSTRTSSG